MKYNFLAVAAFTSLLSFEALALPISGLVNTGADSAAGGQDLNYSLSYSGGDTTGFGAYGYEGTGWPTNGTWIANDSTSQWITPGAIAGTSFDSAVNGTYTWSLTFDLTGFDATSAYFGGRWATDNAGTVSLNGGALNNASTSILNALAIKS